MKEEKLQFYKSLAVFLAGALGPDYEIVVADTEKVLAIRNGYISGRKPGDPVLETARKFLKDRKYLETGWRISYQGITSSGKVLRSSTFFIMDGGEPEGMFCINFDDLRYKELAEAVFHLCHPDSYVQRNIRLQMDRDPEPDTFYADMQSLTEDLIRRLAPQAEGGEAAELSYEQKLEIVRQLYKNGVFSLKGAIPSVAERLSCSQASMYRYLAAVKAEES